MKIIFATNNINKINEIKKIFADTKLEVYSMSEVGIKMDIEETGTTFEENSLIKARAVFEKLAGRTDAQEKCAKDAQTDALRNELSPSDCIVMADDSGFMVDYLNGEPGVYSARYLGEDSTDQKKCAGILERMKDVKDPKDRGCCFRAVITAIMPDGEAIATSGEMRGTVAFAPQGEFGFGYDPILYIPELNKTSAELSMEEKNAISHRGRALEAMKAELAKRR